MLGSEGSQLIFYTFLNAEMVIDVLMRQKYLFFAQKRRV